MLFGQDENLVCCASSLNKFAVCTKQGGKKQQIILKHLELVSVALSSTSHLAQRQSKSACNWNKQKETGFQRTPHRTLNRFPCFNPTIRAYPPQWVLQYPRYYLSCLEGVTVCEMNSHMNRHIGKCVLRDATISLLKVLKDQRRVSNI